MRTTQWYKRVVPDDVRILRSPVIPTEGFVHGFPERTGGVSSGPRASLNLGFRWGDERAHVEENRRIVARAAGYDADQLQVTKHVHGANVWRVGEPQPDPPAPSTAPPRSLTTTRAPRRASSSA